MVATVALRLDPVESADHGSLAALEGLLVEAVAPHHVLPGDRKHDALLHPRRGTVVGRQEMRP